MEAGRGADQSGFAVTRRILYDSVWCSCRARDHMCVCFLTCAHLLSARAAYRSENLEIAASANANADSHQKSSRAASLLTACQAKHSWVVRRSRSHQNTYHFAETWDRTGDLQIFSLTLSQLSYRGECTCSACDVTIDPVVSPAFTSHALCWSVAQTPNHKIGFAAACACLCGSLLVRLCARPQKSATPPALSVQTAANAKASGTRRSLLAAPHSAESGFFGCGGCCHLTVNAPLRPPGIEPGTI